MITRRSLFLSALAAPFIVRASSLMPVKLFEPVYSWNYDAMVTDGVRALAEALYRESLRQTRFAEFVRPFPLGESS